MRGGGIGLGLVVAGTVALSGCGLIGGGAAGTLTSMGCTNLNGGACQEQADRIVARHPGATQIDLTCTAPVCDRKGGFGTAVVTLANGATVNDTFAYTGDPAPLPVPSCTGVPPDVCRSLATSQADGAPTTKRIVAIAVTCTSVPCTANKGDADVKVTMADGTTIEGGTSWEGGAP